MWLPYLIFREAYLIGVKDFVFATSDASTFMQYRGDGLEVIPTIAGC